MIFGNLRHLEEFTFLDERIKECMAFTEKNNLLNFEKGSYTIEGDDLFVNVVEYETTAAENRFWEAHRQYLDVHVLLDGTEQIDLNFIQNMKLGPYVEADDFLPMDGEKNASVILKKDDFLICYPGDGHRTAVAPREPGPVKKAIFKVRIR